MVSHFMLGCVSFITLGLAVHLFYCSLAAQLVFPDISTFPYSLLILTRMFFEQICPSTSRSALGPLAYAGVPQCGLVCPSVVFYPCDMTSPFPFLAGS
ncbi:hypothetical protein C0J52_04884 [Blattella germanica]|nr:hypothetical protein C0J52_04884 [Blattella germanica]